MSLAPGTLVLCSAAGLAAAVLASAALARAAEGGPAEANRYAASFTGSLINPGSIGPRLDSRQVTIWVDRLSTPSEAERFDLLLREKGSRAFEEALAEDAVGRIQVGAADLGSPVGFAWRTADGDRERLLLVAQRPLSFREIFDGSKSKNYPFTVVRLEVGRDGRGTGEVVLAGKIRSDDEGRVEVEDLDFTTARLIEVRRREG